MFLQSAASAMTTGTREVSVIPSELAMVGAIPSELAMVGTYKSGDFGTSETVVSSQESKEVTETICKHVPIPDDEFSASNEECPHFKLSPNRICWWCLVQVCRQSIHEHGEEEHCKTEHDSCSWSLVQQNQWNVTDEPELEVHRQVPRLDDTLEQMYNHWDESNVMDASTLMDT